MHAEVRMSYFISYYQKIENWLRQQEIAKLDEIEPLIPIASVRDLIQRLDTAEQIREIKDIKKSSK